MSCFSSLSKPKQKSCLYLAASLCDGLEDCNFKQVATLLDNKEADPNILMPLHGITPFHLVIGHDSETFAEEVTKLFLRHRGNPNVKSIDGMTPVHVAAAWGRASILQLLLANGGDPLCLDMDNCSPFHYAFQGLHYEAVSILSKYCITVEDEDETPKFKRDLEKVLVNNGDILAEYIASKDSSLKNSKKLSSFLHNNSKDSVINRSISNFKNSSAKHISISNDFITDRRKHRKRLDKNTGKVYNTTKEKIFDFKRKTVEEEKYLIHEIISHLSNSMTSVLNINNVLQNDEDGRLNNYRTSSPKKKQIIMAFNRPIKYAYSNSNEKQCVNTQSSALQIIKPNNNLPNYKCNKISNNLKKTYIISDRKLFFQKLVHQPWKKPINSSNFKLNTPVQKICLQKSLDETIISKSPNLEINTHSLKKKKKLLKTYNFEKKISPKCKTPNNLRSKSPSKLKNFQSLYSQTRRPKKYTTPVNIKTVEKNIESPKKILIPKKQVNGSLEKKISEKYVKTNFSSLNYTYNTSESTISSLSVINNQKYIDINKANHFQNTSVTMDTHKYENDENLYGKSCNSLGINESKKLFNIGEFISGVEILASSMNTNSDFTLDSVNNNSKERNCQKMDTDLNTAILDSFSIAKSLSSKRIHTDNRSFNKCNKQNNVLDSLLCEKGSISSDSSNSFLSFNRHEKSCIDNETDNENNVFPKQFASLENNLILHKDSLSSSCKKLDSDTFISIEEEYKYEDAEEGIAFLEKRLYVASTYTSDVDTSYYSCKTTKSEPILKEMFFLDHVTLREKLKNLGEDPGPITNTTHNLYLKRLHKLETQGKSTTENLTQKNVSNFQKEKDMLRPLLLSLEWIKNLDEFEALEQKIFSEFATPSTSRKWREGNAKHSFNYLLLDPRITKDLPRRSGNLSLSEKWEIFLSAIFYVGKGKRSRPYAHLYDAFKIWVSQSNPDVNNKKVQKILDIWNEGKGVVVLHVFQNTIPVEAYTREAVMIEVLGTQKLGNCKFGDYYGIVATWKSKEKCELGRYLLFKALQILLLEGERQIFPDNL